MKRLSLLIPVLFMVLLFVAAGCAGAQGPAGPAGKAPSGSELEALAENAVEDFLSGGHAPAEYVSAGGRLYDKWWKEAGLSEPDTDHPLWALQSTNSRSGSATWRCKECHGWDYKGAGGAYSSGSHFTGFPGVIKTGATMSKEELMGILQGSTDYRHDFSSILGSEAIEELANFLSEGLINDALYIDYATAELISPDTSHGKVLFDGTCAACHGSDGKQILIDGELSVGDVARDEPTVEILHKIRFGQPGTEMPSAFVNGWSIQDAADVLGYIKALGAD